MRGNEREDRSEEGLKGQPERVGEDGEICKGFGRGWGIKRRGRKGKGGEVGDETEGVGKRSGGDG